MEDKKVICDNCHAEFKTEIHTSKQGELEVQYLKCPTCGETYIVLVTDPTLREMIEENNKLLIKAKKAKGLKYQKAYWNYNNARHKANEYAEKANLIDRVNKHLL